MLLFFLVLLLCLLHSGSTHRVLFDACNHAYMMCSTCRCVCADPLTDVATDTQHTECILATDHTLDVWCMHVHVTISCVCDDVYPRYIAYHACRSRCKYTAPHIVNAIAIYVVGCYECIAITMTL